MRLKSGFPFRGCGNINRARKLCYWDSEKSLLPSSNMTQTLKKSRNFSYTLLTLITLYSETQLKKCFWKSGAHFWKVKISAPPPLPKTLSQWEIMNTIFFNMCICPLWLKITFREMRSPAPPFIANIVVLQPFFGGKSPFLIYCGVKVSKAACRALNYTPFAPRFS